MTETLLLFEEPARVVATARRRVTIPNASGGTPGGTPRAGGAALAYDYESVRLFSHQLAAPLAIEDYVIQSMPSASPAKWHLAHTSWFFERFVLHEHCPGYQPFREPYYYLFNSYYNGAGPQHCRVERGLISRPTVEEVYAYRQAIDDRIVALLLAADDAQLAVLRPLIVLGLHHEQQHQELLLTDLKHMFSSNPLMPAYAGKVSSLKSQVSSSEEAGAAGQSNLKPETSNLKLPSPTWLPFEAGVCEIGHAGEGFCYDNETPRHRVFLEAFELAARPVTNGEYLAFLEDAGYTRPELWLSLGYHTVETQGWRMPLYWYQDAGQWMQFSLAGPVALDPDEPVCHLSYFEADAFARWAGARLPSEAEWERAASTQPIAGNFVESLRFHPAPLDAREPTDALERCFGDVWEWTASAYAPYPGYQPLPGTLGEYNGKFMCNQYVLRGGSCATSRSHIRPTYRNFFAPDTRWQFAGLRLARV